MATRKSSKSSPRKPLLNVRSTADRRSSTAKRRSSVAKSAGTATRKHRRPTARQRRWKKIWESQVVHWFFTAAAAMAVMAAFYSFFIKPYSYRWKPCYGCKDYGVCLPLEYPVHGTDFSHHQGLIDWQQFQSVQQHEYPIRFVFLKATEGRDHKDELFDDNFSQAREHGFIRGAYHFYNPNSDPLEQADFFIRTVRLSAGDLPPVVDVEKRPRNTQKLQQDLLLFLQRLEKHYGVKPFIYASVKYKSRYLDTPELNAYPLWLARYYVETLECHDPWTFWQHTDVGKVPGVTERVDLNVFNGSFEQLRQLTIPSR